MGIKKLIFGIKQHIMPTVSGIDAQQILMKEIGGGKPLMVARFGAVEIKALIYKLSSLLSPLLKTYTYNHIGNNAGFFPVNETMLKNMLIECFKT